jgi:hypothetical protein
MDDGYTWLKSVAERMRAEAARGAAPQPEQLTVRKLLTKFGYQRRSERINNHIRNGLEQFELRTDQDVTVAWIDAPITIETSDPPRRMASVPGYFLRMFKHRRNMRRRLGDLRNTGSAGYEMAMTARGVFDYTVFSGPWVWDLATGCLAVQEAGGAVMFRNSRNKEWTPFETFATSPGVSPRPSELRRWRGSLVLGRRETVERITFGVSPKTYPIRQLRQRVARAFGKGPPPESAPAAPRRG